MTEIKKESFRDIIWEKCKRGVGKTLVISNMPRDERGNIVSGGVKILHRFGNGLVVAEKEETIYVYYRDNRFLEPERRKPTVFPADSSYLFAGMKFKKIVLGDLEIRGTQPVYPSIDTTRVWNIEGMFQDCDQLESLVITSEFSIDNIQRAGAVFARYGYIAPQYFWDLIS